MPTQAQQIDDIPLSLTTVCGGDLEHEFQEIYPKVVAALKSGDKGSISITLDLQRMPDSSTMFNVGYKIAPKLPSKGKGSICTITKDGQLVTEPPVQKPHVVSLFEGGNK